MNVEQYLQSKIRDYYVKNPLSIPNVEKREFGIGEFGKKISARHLAFNSDAEFNQFLQKDAPFYVSYSVAYYKKPSARPMQNKILEGADMLFEFDSDDIPTECKKIHDSWSCIKCGESGQGHVKSCPSCGSRNEVSEWICDLCINQTKKQTKKLYTLFLDDFNIDSKFISIMYSGHKGFHLKISGDYIRDLNQNQRIEFMNYVSEDGLSFKSLGFVPNNKGSIVYNGRNFGLGQKYLDYVKTLFLTQSDDKLSNYLNLSSRDSKLLTKHKSEIMHGLENSEFHKIRSDSTSFWYNVLDAVKDKQRLYIDKQTTIDIHKIVRCENTVHGGSMLRSCYVSYDNLDSFNFMKDASIGNLGDIKIHLKKVPKLLLGGMLIGPYNDEVLSLPSEYSLYLLARGVADEIIL